MPRANRSAEKIAKELKLPPGPGSRNQRKNRAVPRAACAIPRGVPCAASCGAFCAAPCAIPCGAPRAAPCAVPRAAA